MGFPNFDAWRELLPDKVRLGADDMGAQMQGYLGHEHGADGSHTDITADTIDTGPIAIASNDWWISLYRENAAGTRELMGRLTQEVAAGPAADLNSILLESERVMIAVQVVGRDALRLGVLLGAIGGPEQQAFGALSVQERFKLFGQRDVTLAGPPGLPLIFDSAIGPLYSVYRLQQSSAHSIVGIQTLDAVTGARGQVLILRNDSAFPITFQHDLAGVTAFMRLACPYDADLIIGPHGTVTLLYDVIALRWGVVAFTGHATTAYTPVWSSTGTPPVLVNGTLTGEFQRDGSRVSVTITQVIGSSDTIGTGDFTWSLPLAIPYPQSFQVIAKDVSTGRFYTGGTPRVDATHIHAVSTNPAGSPTLWGGPTDPFAWAAGDLIWINGAYFL